MLAFRSIADTLDASKGVPVSGGFLSVFMPPMAARVVTAPMAGIAATTSLVAKNSPVQGGLIGNAIQKTAATAGTVSERATQSAQAALTGDLNTAARRGLQALAEPSKASNRATLEVYAKIPGPIRSIVSTVVGTIFPVTQFVFMALDLQLAADARRIARLKAAQANADAAEVEKIQAEIRQIEAEMAAIQADKDKQAKASGLSGATPSFKESITFAWLNATNKLKE